MFKASPKAWLAKIISSGPSATLLRGAGIAFLAQGLGSGLGYTGQVLLARWMGPNEYGAYVYALTWAQVLAIMAAFGLDAGVIRFIPEYLVRGDWEHLQGLLRWVRPLTFGVGMLLAALSFLLVVLLHPLKINAQAMLFGVWLIPLLTLSEIQTQMIRSTQQIALAYIPPLILQPLLFIGTTYLLAKKIGNLMSVLTLLAMTLALLITIALQSWVIGRAPFKNAKGARAAYETGKWLRVSFPLLLISSFAIILVRADSLLVGFFRGTREIGIYSAAVRTATMVSFILTAVQVIAAPMIASLHAQRNAADLQAVVHLITVVMFWPALVIGITVVLLSGPILNAFGPEFIQARPALVILIIGQLINVGMGPVGMLLSLTGYEKQTVYVFACSAVVNIVLCSITIPLFGLTGAALATALTMVLWNVWLDALVVKYLGIHTSIVFVTRAMLLGKP